MRDTRIWIELISSAEWKLIERSNIFSLPFYSPERSWSYPVSKFKFVLPSAKGECSIICERVRIKWIHVMYVTHVSCTLFEAKRLPNAFPVSYLFSAQPVTYALKYSAWRFARWRWFLFLTFALLRKHWVGREFHGLNIYKYTSTYI